MFDKRINVFMGHYGSGKTFVSVNYAVEMKKQFLNKDVTIYDLDIVNPYYRTVDAEEMLKKSNVQLVVSPYAETNVDIPALNSGSYKMLNKDAGCAVLDIGGDDRGALALGRFRDGILEENDYEIFFVLNYFRPETRSVKLALEIKKEIEIASKLNFTAIVNNSNLGNETTKEHILRGYEFAKEFSSATGLPIKFTSVREDLINPELQEKLKNILPVSPIKYGDWL